MTADTDTLAARTLVLQRTLDATPAEIYRAWTTPVLLQRWFAPRPYRTTACRIDPRPGGLFETTMEGPDGVANTYGGVFLEVLPNERFTYTDALLPGWLPTGKAFMVVTVALSPTGDEKTQYTITVRHWTAEDRDAHAAMGFEAGWGMAADQLAEVLAQG